MRFGLFGSATARHGGPDVDSGQGYKQFVDYNVEAEALGYHSTFLVEHHFTGFGQVSASLALLTWVAAKTKTLRLGTATGISTQGSARCRKNSRAPIAVLPRSSIPTRRGTMAT